jgi:hypothetical protein
MSNSYPQAAHGRLDSKVRRPYTVLRSEQITSKEILYVKRLMWGNNGQTTLKELIVTTLCALGLIAVIWFINGYHL